MDWDLPPLGYSWVGCSFSCGGRYTLEPVSKPVCSHRKERKSMLISLDYRLSFLPMASLASKNEF